MLTATGQDTSGIFVVIPTAPAHGMGLFTVMSQTPTGITKPPFKSVQYGVKRLHQQFMQVRVLEDKNHRERMMLGCGGHTLTELVSCLTLTDSGVMPCPYATYVCDYLCVYYCDSRSPVPGSCITCQPPVFIDRERWSVITTLWCCYYRLTHRS